MDNQHRKISGYRELSQVEIDLMNKIKTQGKVLGDLVAEVRTHIENQRTKAEIEDGVEEIEWNRLDAAEPERWVALARTHFQEGVMDLVRAVAQPEDGL